MTKLKNWLTLIAILISQNLHSQSAGLELVRQESNTWVYRYKTGTLAARECKTAQGSFAQITLDGHQLSTEVGHPQLPVKVFLVEIPLCEKVQVEIKKETKRVVPLSDYAVSSQVMPAQPLISKAEAAGQWVMDRALYNTDHFYGLSPVTVEPRGVMRSAHLAALTLAPIRYNPVSGSLLVTEEIEFAVTFVQPDYAADRRLKELHDNDLFARQFEHVLLPSPIRTKGATYPAPIKYLIVSDPMFREELQRFVAWKKRKGFCVEEAYTDDPAVGRTTASIRQYLKSMYDMATASNPAPTYVLFVGDVEQIPTFTGKTGQHPTDLYYCEWTGDYFPDCYYGRFSARNIDELIPQIDKTLAYEQCTLHDLSYLDQAVLVAGFDRAHAATYADGGVNYLHSQYLNEDYGYTQVHKFLHDAEVAPEDVRAAVGEGAGFVYYTAHCNNYGWSNPRFDTTHVAALNNKGRYGFVLANCCKSGHFTTASCFAEAMMRAADKGAVSYIGASNDTYWDEDYFWSIGFRSEISAQPNYDPRYLGANDKMFHTHGEPYSSWCLTNGTVVAAGNLSVEQSASTLSHYYWEIYHLFGDPSLSTWLLQPAAMTLIAPDTLRPGATQLQVKTVPYASVSLTHQLEWVATACADAHGNAQLRFPMLMTPGTYELSASAQHYMTAFKTVTLSAFDPIHVLASDLQFAEECVPAVSHPVSWHVTVSNVGQTPVDSISLTLQSAMPDLILMDSVAWLEHIGLQDTLLTAAFSALLPDSLEDETVAQFDVVASYGQRTDTTTFFFLLYAPKWQLADYWIEEIEGNGNGCMDAGEWVALSVATRNVGHAVVDSAVATLFAPTSQVTMQCAVDSLIDESGTGYLLSRFLFQLNESVPDFSVIPFYYHLYDGHTHLNDTIFLMAGCAMEDFETGDFAKFAWNHNDFPWEVTLSDHFAGAFSARSAQDLDNQQSSSLYITLHVLKDDSVSFYRKVSSEAHYDLFEFKINAAVMDEASGNLPWERVSFPIKQGDHLLTFSYTKDFADHDGEDAVWIDNILLPAHSVVSGIVHSETAAAGRLYPNPVGDKVTVETEAPVRWIEIFDISGKRIRKIANIASSVCQIDVHDLETGLYILRMQDVHNRILVCKMMKY